MMHGMSKKASHLQTQLHHIASCMLHVTNVRFSEQLVPLNLVGIK